MNFWDQQFSTAEYKYGTRPNAFLVAQAFRLKPTSQILVPGDGEGRNSVWLAQQGHLVVAVDVSSVGLDKARSLAQDRRVPLRTILADLADWSPEPGSADAVVLTYVHLPPSIRQAAHRRLVKALRPNGLLILEAFHPSQLQYASGGPKDSDLLYDMATVRSDFSDLEELFALETLTDLDEGPGHRGPAHVTRWVGRTPADHS